MSSSNVRSALSSNEQVGRGKSLTLTTKPHAFGGAVLSPKHARELTPSLCLAIASALSEQAYRKNAIPYTLWITEAWRVLGWAEPSAALFWEMATMYHTLYLAGRSYAADYQESVAAIPPILSCGSASSMGSGNTPTTQATSGTNFGQGSAAESKKKYSNTASAKELPVWLVGTFLLLHCEESAYLRNLSGQDERRFYGGGSGIRDAEPVLKNAAASSSGKVDFTSLLKHPALSPRTRIHAGWHNDHSHCTAYSLRHLRKLLLLSAVSHNTEAVRACMLLAAIPSQPPPPPSTASRRSLPNHNAEELRRQHDEEHGNVGLDVRLTMEDLERLHFFLQPPSGGGVDDAPLQIGDLLWSSLFSSSAPPTASLSVGDVEGEIREQLELELMMASQDEDQSSAPSEEHSQSEDEVVSSAMSKLTIGDSRKKDTVDGDDSMQSTGRAKQPQHGYEKELTYTHLRGTTILLPPHSHYSEVGGPSSGASTSSADLFGNSANTGRLHDLAIDDCSDAHMYLLQPFEHVTISACTGCTIVVGAVAGLLHVVDCEKTTITCAARRILVSNSFDVLHCTFTPSPPLLVGDNRNCQFAPHNTYYEGIREDLLHTGLAAAVLPETQSPYHGSKQENDLAWPPLQLASNKWKLPVEVAKLEIPQVQTTGSGSSAETTPPGADDKAVAGTKSSDDTMHTPVLLPASEFNVLFVPLESEVAQKRRLDAEEQAASANSGNGPTGSLESQYSRNLAEVLQLSPFRLPLEYERHTLEKADRMKNIQQAMKENLTAEQQKKMEEELNRGFRDWLVSSGNLRQVLDLVHMERRATA